MNQKSSSRNLIGDIVRVMSGETSQQKQVPDWIVESAQAAADEIWNSARGRVMTSELKRTIIRRHLNDAVGNCGCEITSDLPVVFEAAVNSALASPANPHVLNEKYSTPSEKELKKSIKTVETLLGDKQKTKKIGPEKTAEMKKSLKVMKGVLAFGQNYAKAKAKQSGTKKEDIEYKIEAFVELLDESEVSAFDVILNQVIERNCETVSSLSEAFELPSEKELKTAIKDWESTLNDSAKMKKMEIKPADAKKQLNLLKNILTFGKSYDKGKKLGSTKKEEVQIKMGMLALSLTEEEKVILSDCMDSWISVDENGKIEADWDKIGQDVSEGLLSPSYNKNAAWEYTRDATKGAVFGGLVGTLIAPGPGSVAGAAIGGAAGLLNAAVYRGTRRLFGLDKPEDKKASDGSDSEKKSDSKSNETSKKASSSGGGSNDDGPPACPGNQKMVFGKCRKVGG